MWPNKRSLSMKYNSSAALEQSLYYSFGLSLFSFCGINFVPNLVFLLFVCPPSQFSGHTLYTVSSQEPSQIWVNFLPHVASTCD